MTNHSFAEKMARNRVGDEGVSAGVHPRVEVAPSPERVRFFDALFPLAVLVAVCGIIPVAFKPFRVSFHPWRSTLLYSLAVNAGVLWSVRRVMLLRGEVFASPASSQVQRYTCLTSLAHVGGYIILPFAWLECGRVEDGLSALAAPLEAEFGKLLEAGEGRAAWPGRWSRWLVRLVLAHSLLFGPVIVAFWIGHVAPDGADWTHFPGHLYQIIITDVGIGCTAVSLLTVSDLASRLCDLLSEEVSGGLMTAARMRDFRLAWVQLRRLAEGSVSMPATLLAIMTYVMLQTLLNTYQGLVSIMAGFQTFAAVCFLQSMQIFIALVILCDAGHRTVRAVQYDFLAMTQRVFYSHNPNEEVAKQTCILMDVISSRPPHITCGGFSNVTRHTMVATLISYLIILIQFRQAEQMQERSAYQAQETANALDSCNC